MHILPVNFAGLLLILAALALFILEAKYTKPRRSAVGGRGGDVAGSAHAHQLSYYWCGRKSRCGTGVTLPFAALTVLLMRLVLRTAAGEQTTGREQLTGAAAEVTEAIQAVSGPAGESVFAGMVRMHGELWRAVASQAIPAGARCAVCGSPD